MEEEMKTKKVKNHKATKPETIEPKASDIFEKDPSPEQSLQLQEIEPAPAKPWPQRLPNPNLLHK